jgi:sugar O-acyltransferase (sialic acid O-acetyltransferase NeuD family)
MQLIQIAIYGGGGFAREVAWLAGESGDEQRSYEAVCFIDDDKSAQGNLLNGIPVMSLEEARSLFPDACVVSGVGSPRTRQTVMERAKAAGFTFATLIHARVEYSRWVTVGPGTVICAGNILTTNIALGCHTQINLDCTIGHDVIMGDYTTLAPGVHVSGCVHFGQRVYVGTGAVILNGTREQPLTIGDDAVIGAGACVLGAVPADTTVVGVPAKPLHKR